jgi:adenylate cyclase
VSDPADRDPALRRLTEVVLGDPIELTRGEASLAAGLTVEEARPYWRAMGFADVGQDRAAFTRTDVERLLLLVGWVRDGVLDQARAIEVVRSLGQTASRLADWQVDMLGRILAESEQPVQVDQVAEGMERMLPGLESLLVHAWRRHLAAVVGRAIAGVEEPLEAEEVGASTVGFADIAGFTRLVRVLADEELAAMVTAFETGAADIVAAHGARLVKTLGDEVMFVAPDADVGVAIATAMHAMASPDGAVLRLRIGVATGRLVSLMGDYYGDTVNRASRLTALARPGGTLVDPATEEGLTDQSGYLVRHHRPRALRGLGLVRASSVTPRPRVR